MSTQSIRNELKQNISKVISDVKQQIITEGRKRIMELKDKLLSPEYIIKILTAEINADSCSLEGRDKFKELAAKLTKTLEDMEKILQQGLDVFAGLEEKIGKISSKVELPPGTPNPMKSIQEITDAISPITKILKYVIMAAPAILAANVSSPGTGGPVSGTSIANTNNGVNLAKVKIKEYVNLFKALPKILDKYISMADIVFNKIAPIKQQLEFILGEIKRLKAFIIYLELDFNDKCNRLDLSTYPPGVPSSTTTTVPPTVVHPTLEEITALINELYGNMLEDLISRGDNRAIKRVYTLGAQFQRLINTQVAQRYIGGGIDDSMAGNWHNINPGTGNW